MACSNAATACSRVTVGKSSRSESEADENTKENLEAPPGFEPGMEVLQTSALPLGDGADRNRDPEDRSTLQGNPGRG